MDEKRKLKRRHLIYYLRIYSGKSKTPLGFLVDIHSEGIMIISEKEIKTGKQFDLKMDLPKSAGEKKSVLFKTKSIWCTKGVNSDLYETGFEFVNISEKDLQMIDNIVYDFGFDD